MENGAVSAFRLGRYMTLHSQRVHVGTWYILGAQMGSHIPTLRPKYIPYGYMDPLGLVMQNNACKDQGLQDTGLCLVAVLACP